PEAKKRQYILADNKLSERGGGWDLDMLQAELRDLRMLAADLDLTVSGFSAGELDALIGTLGKAPALPDGSRTVTVTPEQHTILTRTVERVSQIRQTVETPVEQRVPIQPRIETVSVKLLKPHPRNYQAHPPDQLQHIVRSIEENGLYRNVVVAEDYTILAGHGLTQAWQMMGRDEIPVIRLAIAADSPPALKLLVGDNAISHLAEIDDRAF